MPSAKDETMLGGASDTPTVGQVLGEMTWLLTQSPIHRGLSVGDLDWLLMPPIALRQYYVFRDKGQPIGFALWARCDKTAEEKLQHGILSVEGRLTQEEWSGGNHVWLIDLVAPFATEQNRHRELMMADLIAGPLGGQAFKFHRTDLYGERTIVTIESDAREKLKELGEKMSS